MKHWRNWSVIVVLILANYLVFSLLAVAVFPAPQITVPTHVPQPTFTPGGKILKQVDPLTYEFLTPTAPPTVRGTTTRTLTGTPVTLAPTSTITATPTISATDTLTVTPIASPTTPP